MNIQHLRNGHRVKNQDSCQREPFDSALCCKVIYPVVSNYGYRLTMPPYLLLYGIDPQTMNPFSNLVPSSLKLPCDALDATEMTALEVQH